MKPNKTLRERMARLLPAGVPRYIRAYDNGGPSVSGGSIDRYTVLFTGRAADRRWKDGAYHYQALAMNAAPFHPQGFGQHVEAVDGSHHGKRVEFAQLPEDCRRLTVSDYCAIWALPLPADMLSPMVRAYLTAALWTEDDDARSGDYEANGHPGELWHLFAWGTIERAREDCAKFSATMSPQQVSMRQLWENARLSAEQAGHDLWLSRNGHGSGFFDRAYDTGRSGDDIKQLCDTLQEAARRMGSCDLYTGDDARLYFT